MKIPFPPAEPGRDVRVRVENWNQTPVGRQWACETWRMSGEAIVMIDVIDWPYGNPHEPLAVVIYCPKPGDVIVLSDAPTD